ncbi:MAG TPA: hypothetical protein VKR55_28665 [Bradyrhizobium sp.]|uniref:hypothetical protein n=1 Tax=Bradyrhizobium sp. TaxID=376 RepID=UPI002CFBC288|nr:hypothetical protein [Bradyrhizobium sp.]HLZ06109.1 hypothetical protein [Bradyrhizobium sp.]
MGAADDERSFRLRRVAKMVKLSPAELTELGDFAFVAPSLNGGTIEAHRVFARADQDRFWRIRHAQLSTS